MAKPTKKKSHILRREVSLIYLFLAVLVFFLLALGLGRSKVNKYVENNSSKIVYKGKTYERNPKKTCSKYGTSTSLDDVYLKYTVKSGDTIQKIANRELKNPSKVSDLIYINRTKYPNLTENTYIEVGWTLYLPQDYYPTIQVRGVDYAALPYIEWGQIISIEPDGWITYLDENNPVRAQKINNAKFFDKNSTDYQVNDCVKFVVDSGKHEVIAVFPQ